MAVLEFLRVLFAFALTFLVLPLLAEGYRLWRGEPMDRQPADWIPILLRAFVFASFAAETLGLVLGSIRLCLPGLIVTGCVLWSVRGFLVAHQVRSGLKEADAQTVWRPLIALLEPQQSSELRSQLAGMRFEPAAPSATAAVLCAMLALTLLGFARPAIQQVSFDHPESYLRVISLAGLTRGNLWQADGSVAFLAPLVSFSGLDAASVIQFTGPILSAIFAALITVCVWQVWRTTTAAAVTLGLFFCIALAYSHAQWELLPNAMAIVYWTAGAAIWPYSRRHSLMAAATGFMIAPGQWVALVICLLLVLAVQLSRWLRSRWKFTGSVLAAVQCLAIIGAITFAWQRANPDPQLSQYESAARTCKKITRQFHRNEWLVVSPFQELAFTYGNGWHLELSQFVSDFHHTDVSRAAFSFPYQTPDVFFFVERRPLRPGSRTGSYEAVWRYAPAESSEWSAFLYGDPLGRASLEYQAADLLSAYAANHKNLSLFYQDDVLAVYHLAATHAGG